MHKFFRTLWLIISAPFSIIIWLGKLPFRTYKKLHHFLTYVPEDRPVVDALATAITSKDGLFAQIDVLRKHLFRALIALVITVSLSFLFTERLIDYLAQPVGGIEVLKAIEVTESIGVFMRVALMAGVAIALPYIAFELWLFVAPGLMPRSRKFGLVGIPLATILFLAGAAFAYFVMLPAALPFLLNFMGIRAELRPNSYFSFITGVMFWIGVAFEFPLVIYVLTAVGFVKPDVLKQQWRLAIVLIAVLAAAITPTVDPVNMALVMLPMSLLYFISIGLSYVAYAGREKSSEATSAQA